MKIATQTRQPKKGLTFEDVLRMFQETDKKVQETSRAVKENGEQLKETREQIKETTRAVKETTEQVNKTTEQVNKTTEQVNKTTEQVKELSANIGGVNNSLGDMTEGLLASDLHETFAALGLYFDNSIPNYIVKDKKTKCPLVEVDRLLVNGKIAMVVETKTTLTRGDVDKHIERMEILRHEPNSLFANRKLYGAMGGVKMSKKARQYAIEQGFFVIELTGDTIKIKMPEGFKPKIW